MTQIVLTVLLSVFGLVLLFVLLRKAEDGGAKNSATVPENPLRVAGLSAVSIPQLDVLLGKDDYSRLRARPELRGIRKRFLRDRRRIALLWLRGLQTDLRTLWQFRRFLVRNGLRVTFKEEAGVGSAALATLIYLEIARAAIFILGPFALVGALTNSSLLLQLLTRRSVAPLSRVPPARRTEIEELWVHHLQLRRAG